MPKKLTCQNCGDDFAARQKIDGKVRHLYKRKYCLDCSPFNGKNTQSLEKISDESVTDRWSEENVKQAVESSRSYAQTLRHLGLSEHSGGNQKQLKKYINKYKLSTDHFDGLPPEEMRGKGPNTIPLEDILVKDSTYSHSSTLKKRLIKAGKLEEECYKCGITHWNGQKLSLQLDHINGENLDHRIENLRMLCPNCHSLTPTFAGRKTKKPPNTCVDCEDEIRRESIRCKPCHYKHARKSPDRRKFDPSPEELEKLVWEKPMTKLAEKWGVSDRAIKKRCRKYDIKTPGVGYWQKKKAGKLG